MNMKHFVSATLVSTLALQAACSSSADPDPAELEPDGGVAAARLVVTANARTAPVLQGASTTIEVSVQRDATVSGAVTVTAAGLPPGVTCDPLVIAAGATSGAMTLVASATAPHSLPTAVSLVATADGVAAADQVTVTVYGAPGTLDTSFGGGKLLLPAGAGDDYANALAVQANGKLVIVGRAAERLGDFALIRLDLDGNLDATFGTGGRVLTDFAGASETAYAVAVQPDGKIVVAGTTAGSGTGNDFAVARYLPSGELDGSFGSGGKVVTPLGPDADTAYAMVLQPDGKIVVGGDTNNGSNQTGLDFALVRYLPDGTLDASFGSAGIVTTPIAAFGGRDSIYALAVQTIDGQSRIVAAGGEGDFRIARYLPSGALDSSFGSGGVVSGLFGSTIGAARALAITPDSAIAIAGHAHHDVAIAQLTASGALDTSFSGDGKLTTAVSTSNWDEAQAITVDRDGNLLVAGWAYEGGSSAGNFVVMRYLASGQLDTRFGGTGIVVTPVAAGTKADQAMAVAIQHDERIPMDRVVSAGFANVSNSDFAVTRYWR
jgi:uncharacterized delta-60 repeat protein